MSDNIEFFEVLHNIQSTADEITQKIAVVTEGKAQDEIVPIPVAALTSMYTILNLQGKIVTKLVEENQMILDRLEQIGRN